MLLTVMGASVLAQATSLSIAGTYDASQMELVAGLHLGDDGRFEYALSYGALDEVATGSWKVDGDAIVLDSDPVALPVFELVGTQPGRPNAFSVELDVPEQLPLALFSVLIHFADGTTRECQFAGGPLHLELEPSQVVTGVALVFPLYEVASPKTEVPADTGSMHFRFEPNDLGRVAFAHQVLTREGDTLLMERYARVLRLRKQP